MAERSYERLGEGATSKRSLDRGRRRDKRITSLQGDLERDRRRYRRMLDQYDDLRAELEQLNAAIQRRQRLLDALKETSPGASPPAVRDRTMTKPEIAERVLFGSLEPLFPRQVRDEAVQKGWLSRSGAASNQLSVAMSKMALKGRLKKGADGRYSLPGRG